MLGDEVDNEHQQSEVTEIMIDKTVTKEVFLKMIYDSANKAVQENLTDLYYYYTGHSAKDSGDWVGSRFELVEGEYLDVDYQVSLEECLDQIQSAGFNGGVNIKSDSNFSGHWSTSGYKLWQTGKYDFKCLSIGCSCDCDQFSQWGKYIEVDFFTFSAARTKYIENFGYATFKSKNIEKNVYPIWEVKRKNHISKIQKVVENANKVGGLITTEEEIRNAFNDGTVQLCFVSRFPNTKELRIEWGKIAKENNIPIIFAMDYWTLGRIVGKEHC